MNPTKLATLHTHATSRTVIQRFPSLSPVFGLARKARDSLQCPENLVKPPADGPDAKHRQSGQQRVRRDPILVLGTGQHAELPVLAVLVDPERRVEGHREPEQATGRAVGPV